MIVLKNLYLYLLYMGITICYLYNHCSKDDHQGQQHHAAQAAEVDVFEDEKACPAQLIYCMWWVTHLIHILHLQLFD